MDDLDLPFAALLAFLIVWLGCPSAAWVVVEVSRPEYVYGLGAAAAVVIGLWLLGRK